MRFTEKNMFTSHKKTQRISVTLSRNGFGICKVYYNLFKHLKVKTWFLGVVKFATQVANMPKFVMKIYNCKFGAFPYAPYKVCNALVADFVKAVVKVQRKQKKPLASLLLPSVVKVLRSGQSSKLKFLYIVKLKQN